MYTTDHIFLVLPIKDLINKDGEPTTPFKLATGKNLQYHIYACFILSMCCIEIHYTCWEKRFKCASQRATGFLRHLCWNSTASKRVSCVRTSHKEGNIFIWCCFWWKFFQYVGIYITTIHKSDGYAFSCVINIYATSSREQTGDIITLEQFEEGNLLSESYNVWSETCDNTEISNKSDYNSTMPPLISEE